MRWHFWSKLTTCANAVQEFSVVRFYGDKSKADAVYKYVDLRQPKPFEMLILDSRGVEPLTGDDIAEVVVFAAGRRENVVIADTLIFPSHQVCDHASAAVRTIELTWARPALAPCIASHRFTTLVVEA